MNSRINAPDPDPSSRQQALQRLLDGMPLGMLLLDRDGSIVLSNRLAARRLGDAAELAGRDLFRAVLPQPDGAELGERYRRADPGDPLAWEGTVTRDGQTDRVALQVYRVPLEGTLWGLVVLGERSTPARDEDRIRRLERLAKVGEMTESAAHEINNPLASIRSFAQLLASETATAEQRQALGMIVQETARIAQIVDNVINFAHEQGLSGQEPINLSELVSQVLEAEREALDAAGIEVRPDLDPALSPVLGDPASLQQAVANLVLYAEEALAGKEEGTRLLVLRTRESSEGVLLSVYENGPGIPRDVLPHIFDSLRASKLRGVGLRLAITATILREHGGAIVAESDEGRGTAFFVRLPRTRVAAPLRPNAASAPAARGGSRGALRVLIADDEATLRLAIALFLQRRGHVVTQASDAHEAWRLVQEREFDVAMVDVRMPGDGLALLEKLDEIPSMRGRAVMMTGDIAYARTHQGLKEGRPYLVKPFDMNAAVDLLETLVRQNQVESA